MHGQDSNTDIAVSTIFLACYFFECIVLLVDVVTPDQHLGNHGVTGVTGVTTREVDV